MRSEYNNKRTQIKHKGKSSNTRNVRHLNYELIMHLYLGTKWSTAADGPFTKVRSFSTTLDLVSSSKIVQHMIQNSEYTDWMSGRCQSDIHTIDRSWLQVQEYISQCSVLCITVHVINKTYLFRWQKTLKC